MARKKFGFDQRMFENFNWPLLLSMMGLCIFGLVNLYSVSNHGQGTWYIKQGILFGCSLLVVAVMTFFDYQYLKRFAFPVYCASLLLLIAVLAAGHFAGGAQRWLNLGFVKFQPSELAKLVVVIMLADYFSRREFLEGLGFKDLLGPAALLLVPFALILKQPDLGTALHLAASAVPMFFFARLKLQIWIAMAAAAALGILAMVTGAWQYLVTFNLIKEYQLKRVETFLDPEGDPKGAGYQIIQSKNAIGSGEFFGRGFMEGTQQKNGFLPKPETDFAFAALAEEWGFVGAAIVLGLFLCLVIAGLTVARRCQDRFGVFLALGLTSFLFWQMAINIGMVTGLLPVVGIPLPFISYGGTSLVVTVLTVGVILNVSMRRYKFQDETVRHSPEVWRKTGSSEPKTPVTVPVRKLSNFDPDDPESHPHFRMPHRKPWQKHLRRKHI